MHGMTLQRTSKALQELTRGSRTLSLRARSVLLLAEGTPLAQLNAMYNGQGHALVQQLIDEGYLHSHRLTPDSATSAATVPSSGTLSLAGLRMHLFDLCERFFANRLHSTAEQMRHMLREARDVPSMLQARDHLLWQVHIHAGAERAESLRQQLAGLLPEAATSLEHAD